MNQEFIAYREELESRSHFTTLSEEEIEKYDSMCIKPQQFSLTKAASHPFLWAYHVVGVKPRDYQFKMLNDMAFKQLLASVTARQIGKSTCIALFAFWAAYNNIYPSGTNKDTKIMIVSHTEQAAKELIRTIESFINLADDRMAMYTRDRVEFQRGYFKNKIKNQTQFEIQFPKGLIVAYPPTSKVRGRSMDVLIIDEAAWLNHPDPDAFFEGDAKHTTDATDGKIFLFSTPKSNNGFFYNVIQPEATHPLLGWSRIWYPWTVIKDERVLEKLWEDRLRAVETGNEQTWKIEMEASFMSGKYSFFNPESIDSCVIQHFNEEFTWNYPVTLGIDFGDVHSRTVVSVAWHDPTTQKIRLISLKEFPAGYNNADIATYVESLRSRYPIKQVVVDDCVGGKTAIELLKRKRFHVIPFNFTADKEEYYQYLKVAVMGGRLQLYPNVAITSQLKSLEASETPTGKIQIKKPRGGRDDICDAIMLCASPFILPQKRSGMRFANIMLKGGRKNA